MELGQDGALQEHGEELLACACEHSVSHELCYDHPCKYTTFFRSVIAFGRIHIIEDEGGTHDVDNIVGGYHEKLKAARMLGNRNNPNQDEALQKEIESGLSRMLAIRFDIEHLTGKEAIELVRGRQIMTDSDCIATL